MSYFNLRVYGLVINGDGQLLVSDEKECGKQFTKFPGGGVEIGEGLNDALKREFLEECAAEIRVLQHFYTTDFYEQSIFNDSQVVSVYYMVEILTAPEIDFKTKIFDFGNSPEPCQSFRWISLEKLREADVTFRTDKKVVELLLTGRKASPSLFRT